MATTGTPQPGKRFWSRTRILGLAPAILLTIALPISIDQGYFRYNAYVLPCLGLLAAILYLIFILTIPAVEKYLRQLVALNRTIAVLFGLLAAIIVIGGLVAGFLFALHLSKEHVQETRRKESAAPPVSVEPASPSAPSTSPDKQAAGLREEELSVLQQIVDAKKMNDWKTVSSLAETELTRAPDLLILYFEASLADWHLCRNKAADARNGYFIAHATLDPRYKNKSAIEDALKNRDLYRNNLPAPGCPDNSGGKGSALKAKAKEIRESYMAQHPDAQPGQVVTDVNKELAQQHIPVSITILPPSVPCTTKHGVVIHGDSNHISNVHSYACFTEDVINVTGNQNEINGVDINPPGRR
jgi:hypothetical protein